MFYFYMLYNGIVLLLFTGPMTLCRPLSTSRSSWGQVHTKYEVKNGVAVIKLDSPNSKVNTLNVETMTELKENLDLVSKDPNVKAAVLISGKLFILVF